jgi:hypothetical protein
MCHVFAEIRMEQDLSCFAKSTEAFSDHDCPDQERRIQNVEIAKEESVFGCISPGVY